MRTTATATRNTDTDSSKYSNNFKQELVNL